MQRTLHNLAVILVVPALAASPVLAARRAHHPWLAKKHHSAARVASTERTDRTERSASRASDEAAPIPDNDTQTASNAGNKVARQAMHYTGSRYRFGGMSKYGMDCSGLISRVWDDLKLKKIPRASSALYNTGKPVHLAELQPGDLVFFKNTYKHGISHVGVYAGRNKFVHASNHTRGVIITKLSDPYYQLHYAGARRLY